MKSVIPRWKYWLSYITEVHIESCPSEHNPHLYVSLISGKIQLSTEHAIYSYDDRYDNYKESFEQIDLVRLKPKKILILGLGLGSVITILERHHQIFAEIRGVEIDENIVYLFNKYVALNLASPCTIQCADAQVFVQLCEETFDLICMDVFLDDLVPDSFERVEFLEKLKSLLSPDGLLLYNRLASTKEDVERTLKFFEGAFSEVFESPSYLTVHENMMFQNTDEYNIA